MIKSSIIKSNDDLKVANINASNTVVRNSGWTTGDTFRQGRGNKDKVCVCLSTWKRISPPTKEQSYFQAFMEVTALMITAY